MLRESHQAYDKANSQIERISVDDLASIFHYSESNIAVPLLKLTRDLEPEKPGWDQACRRDFGLVAEEVCADVIAVPFLTTAFCRVLVHFARSLGNFSCDASKDAFAAPELKLHELSPMIEGVIRRSVVRHLAPLIYWKWGMVPALIHRPFLIRYSLETKAAMGRHHDMRSDVSISVNLNDEFGGGGLFFVRQGYSTGKLPVGTAVLFPGRVTHLHEALPITCGERIVLTIWTEHRE
jgi:2-oxoglutarate-Fe(II)-dependent oxygenase superfamily protein